MGQPVCPRCLRPSYRPEPLGGRHQPFRCSGCHRTNAWCDCREDIEAIGRALDREAPRPDGTATRIAGLREVIRAANWHDATALWSVQNDLDWLLSRAEEWVLASSAPDAAPRFDHDGTFRHHHDADTAEPIWWQAAEQFGGEKRPHQHYHVPGLAGALASSPAAPGLLDDLNRLREAAEAALTDFVYVHGSDFDEHEFPGVAWGRAALAETLGEPE